MGSIVQTFQNTAQHFQDTYYPVHADNTIKFAVCVSCGVLLSLPVKCHSVPLQEASVGLLSPVMILSVSWGNNLATD